MHRRLFLGFALFGLVFTVVYLLRDWLADTAQSLATTQPTTSGVIRNAIALLLSFSVLGVVAAVVAHKMDSRVYIASDVEHLLHCAPIAQLPDFSEVSDEVADKHIMRLAVWLDSAFKDRGVRNCVFTGTGPGAGVTTVAIRVKELLETLGRVVVIANATESPPVTPNGGVGGEQNRIQQGGRLGVLPPQAAECAEGHREEMVLTDAPPIMSSAETEYLARHADCTVVVIESGMTKRAEIRTVSGVLECLHVPVSGFVLNRVRSAKADRAFCRSVEEVEPELRYQDLSDNRQTIRTLRFAVESGRGSLKPEPAMKTQADDCRLTEINSVVVPAEEPDPAAAEEPIPQAEPNAAAAPQKPEPGSSSVPTGAELSHEEILWPLVQTPANADTAPTQSLGPRAGTQQAVSNDSAGSEPAGETAQPALEEATQPSLPRLCELRGMLLSSGLKEVDLARHGVPQSTVAELLMKEIAPFAPLFEYVEPAQSSAAAYTAQAELKRAIPVRTFIPVPESEDAPGAENGADSPGNGSRRGEVKSAFMPAGPAKNRWRHGGNRGRTRHGESHAKPEEGENFEELRTLPSKKGQYESKD
jgi:hypothetical protein